MDYIFASPAFGQLSLFASFGAEFEEVGVVQQAAEQRGDGRIVAEQQRQTSTGRFEVMSVLALS